MGVKIGDMMKKVAAVAFSAVLLAGCAPTPAQESETPSASPAEQLIDEFRAANPDADRATDEQWLDVAQSVCEAFESGATANQIVDSMQGSSLDANEAGSMVVLSAEYLCPEYN